MASIEVDPDTNLARIVPAPGRSISVASLNAALGGSPYRVTSLRARR